MLSCWSVEVSHGKIRVHRCAVDIRCEDCKQAVRYAAILIEIFDEHKKDWDEIILERNRTKFWLHFAVRKEGNRRKVTCVSV